MEKRPSLIPSSIRPVSTGVSRVKAVSYTHLDVYKRQMNIRSERTYGMMSLETLDTLVEKTLNQVTHMATFAFQGGEPTLAGLDFYRSLIEIEKKHNHRGIEIHNSLQTNGIVIDEEWAQFLHDNQFLVGLSLDGYQELHDENRKFPDGTGSFGRVMETARLFQKYQVEFNILTVVTAVSYTHLDVYKRQNRSCRR